MSIKQRSVSKKNITRKFITYKKHFSSHAVLLFNTVSFESLQIPTRHSNAVNSLGSPENNNVGTAKILYHLCVLTLESLCFKFLLSFTSFVTSAVMKPTK